MINRRITKRHWNNRINKTDKYEEGRKKKKRLRKKENDIEYIEAVIKRHLENPTETKQDGYNSNKRLIYLERGKKK